MTLDLRDIAIIDSLPVYQTKREILVVGCGEGRLDRVLDGEGYTVHSTDVIPRPSEPGARPLPCFRVADILLMETFKGAPWETVICSEVLEHLVEYKAAFKNLLDLTERRLIVTIPVRDCFYGGGKGPGDHVVFWDDQEHWKFREINEFKTLAAPYSTSIRKIKTKSRDRAGGTLYLIIVDKEQPL